MAAACFTKRSARFEYKSIVLPLHYVDKSYIWNDNEQSLDIHIAMIAADIAQEGRIVQAVNQILSSLK